MRKLSLAPKENPMDGEPILVMLVEDNVDHAELVTRELNL